MTTNNPRLYLSISASLRSPTLNHAPLNKPNYQFPREIAASLLPKSINIKELREKKRSSIEKQRSENSIIRHVDGSKHEFKSDASKKLWIQPKQEEKLESQYYVKRLRHQEKIFSLLLLYFSTSKIPYILRKPIWRLTRIEPNHDLRSYQAFWVIEDEMESSQYLVPTTIHMIRIIYLGLVLESMWASAELYRKSSPTFPYNSAGP